MKNIILVISVFLAGVLLTGCGGSEGKTDKQSGAGREIKIGATAGPHAQVAEAVAKEGKKQGLNIRVIEFSDYITPNKALAEGEIDLVSYQHKPFMENFNRQNKSDLTAIGKTILMRMGIYSDKYRNLNELPENAVIAIPNDPTNGGRGLVLLEKAGLLQLSEGKGFNATVKDVVGNPKSFQFRELEAAQLPRSLQDVDAAVITMNYVMSGGLDVNKQGLFWEANDEPLAVMILAARSEDKNNATYLKIAELFHSEGVHKYIADTFKGTIVPAE